jgi:hypothetical protein
VAAKVILRSDAMSVLALNGLEYDQHSKEKEQAAA